MPKGRRGWGQPPPRRLKGVAKAMTQAGVQWDPKEAAQLRQETSAAGRPSDQSRSRAGRLPAQPATPQRDWMPITAFLAALCVV